MLCAPGGKPPADPVAPVKSHGKKPAKDKPSSPPSRESYQDKVDNGTEGRIIDLPRNGRDDAAFIDKGVAAGVREGTEARS